MHRFLIAGARPDAQGLLDLSPIAHQLQRVLRAAPGQEVLVLDGSGRAYATRLQELSAHHALGQVFHEMTLPEPALHLTLFQCALKADKFEWVLQKGVELGVSCFVPVLSARTVVRPLAALEKKRTRWETILREATEQCGRGQAPILAPAQDWADAVRSPIPPPAVNISHPIAPLCLKLLPWEETAPPLTQPAAPTNVAPTNVAPTDATSLGRAVTEWRATHVEPSRLPASHPPPFPTRAHIACCIGPEGGLETGEVEAAQAAGWQVVGLGPRVMRAETAALAATAIIMQLCGEFEP